LFSAPHVFAVEGNTECNEATSLQQSCTNLGKVN